MRRLYIFMKLFLFIGIVMVTSFSYGQVTTNGGSGLSATYPSLNDAITALNGATIASPVFITLTGDETAPAGGYVITASGSAENTITIQGTGNLTASNALIVGVLHDAIIELQGADYVTIDGFTLLENSANTTTAAASNNMTEWGIALLYASTTNGAQNNTIKNCTIDLNRTYQNTFGIYSNSTHSTATITDATATTTNGGNSGLIITGNDIKDVNLGIVVVGPKAAADHNDGLIIGGTVDNANSITNFGTTGSFSSYANVSGTVNGILVRNTKNFNISFNTITSSDGGVTAGNINGIQIPAFSTAPTGDFTNSINNNSFSVKSGNAGGTIFGLNIGSNTHSSSSTININNNDFNNFGHTVSGTAAITFITQGGSHLNQNINDNTFTNINVNTTGNITFISNSVSTPTGGTQNVNNNSIISAFNKTGSGGTVTIFTTGASSVAGTIINNNNNNFSNISVAGSTAINGWYNNDGGNPTKTIQGNTFSNWTGGSGTITVMTQKLGISSVFGNTISNITGSGNIIGISVASSSSGTNDIYQNTISALSSTGTIVTGLAVTGGTLANNIYRNNIYNLTCDNASGSVNGMLISGGTLVNVYNNFISDLKTPSSNIDNSIIGINITAPSAVGLYYNTIFLNGTSSGALFGSSALCSTTSPTIEVINNIFVNTSTQNGAGYTCAFRRTGTVISSYKSTSNNNLFYAGVPGVNNLIFFDGTNSDQTLTDFKARVTPSDEFSITENPPFIDVTTTPYNLHLKTTIPTLCESGAAVVSIPSITSDYDGEARNSTTPDIGADEGDFRLVDLIAPSILYTTLSNTSLLTNRSLIATITDDELATGANQPVLYWQINSGVWTSVSPSNISGDNFTFEFGSGVVPNDVVNYYIIAQDVTGNITSYPTGATCTANPPAAIDPPTNPDNYTVLGTICGIKTVGTGGDYSTLTSAINDLNSKELCGPLTFILTDANYNATTGEFFPLVINSNIGSSLSNYIIIKPATSVSPKISGSSSNSLIEVYASYFVVDGSNTENGTSKDLTVENTGTQPNSGLIYCFENNNILIKNINGYNTNGSSFGDGIVFETVDYIEVSNCQIYKSKYGITANTNSSNVLFTNNTIGSTNFSDKIEKYGIWIDETSDFEISGNQIFGLTTSDMSILPAGISITNNCINGKISNNIISDIENTYSNGSAVYGILLSSTNVNSNILVSNNIIKDITSKGFASMTTDNGYGINIELGGGYGIYFNTIKQTRNQTAGNPACLIISSNITTAEALDIRNNIFYINETVGNIYTVICNASNSVIADFDYNDYFTTGTNLGYFGSTDILNLADWRIATGGDANSISFQPNFISSEDLHLIDNMNCAFTGTPVIGILDDIDGDTRSLTNPIIGADEFTFVDLSSPTASDIAVCSYDEVPNLTVTVFGIAKWYSDNSLTTLVYTGTSFPSGNTLPGTYTYYVTDSLGTCSSSSTTVNLTITEVSDAIAGDDEVICDDNYTLSAEPVAYGTGTWACTNTSVIINNPTLFNTTIEGLSIGSNTLTWTVENNTCISTDDVILTNSSIELINAGENQEICENTTILNGNVPSVGQNGIWTCTDVNVLIDDISSATSGVTELPLGETILTWTIDNGVCQDSDEVLITNSTVSANAGAEQNLCDSFTQLEAIAPITGTGFWSLISGSVIIENSTSPTSNLTEIDLGANILNWMVVNSICSSSATVTINNYSVTANAGEDQTSNNNSVTLNANDPTPNDGLWTVVSGSGDFADENLYNTVVNNISEGINIFNWTVSNAYCSESDEVEIEFTTVINEIGSQIVSVYPNPSNGIINISVKETSKLFVYDLTGKLVLTSLLNSETNLIDMNSYSKGIYNLVITSNSGKSNIKIILQ